MLEQIRAAATYWEDKLPVVIIPPSVEIISPVRDGEEIMRFLEAAMRTAYKSEDRIGPDSHTKILKHILSLKHESTLEHVSFTFRIITNCGVTHELVRHRIASYTQESTRYVNYGKKGVVLIFPYHLIDKSSSDVKFWASGQLEMKNYYTRALEMGWKPQEARGLLSNDIKTEIVCTMNIRELRSFFRLRTDSSAHPDIRVVATEMLRQVREIVPLLFEGI